MSVGLIYSQLNSISSTILFAEKKSDYFNSDVEYTLLCCARIICFKDKKDTFALKLK